MNKRIIIMMSALFIVGITLYFITQIQSIQSDPSAQVEENMDKGSSPLVLEISKPVGSPLSIPINQIPEFAAYLSQETDPASELNRTMYDILNISDQEQYVLLKYSCGNKQCSTILIKVTDSSIESLPLATGIFQDFKLSSNRTDILMRYGFNEGSLTRHIVIPVNLTNMALIPFVSSEQADIYSIEPTFPIVDYNWIHDSTFQISTADLPNSDNNSLQQWYESGTNMIKEVSIELDTST